MKHQRLNLIIIFELSFLFIIQGLQTSDPFYLVAHMINNQAAIDWAVSEGANAIENDLNFDENGNPTIIQHGGICDCDCAILPDDTCNAVLDENGPACDASDDAATHMQYIAKQDMIALYYVDSKVDASWGNRLDKAGSAVIPFIDNNLFSYGYKGKVLISAPTISVYNYIQAAVIAANKSVNKDRYFFTFDGEGDDYEGVMGMLSRLTKNRMYSTGSSSCSPITYDSGLKDGIAGKNLGENGLNLVWTINMDDSIQKYIKLGVQAILTNQISAAKQIVNAMHLTLANPTSPIPVSTVNVQSPNKCSCDFYNDGCMISWPAPSKKACKCVTLFGICGGVLVSCDPYQPKCINPDESEEACQLGKGNCNGY